MTVVWNMEGSGGHCQRACESGAMVIFHGPNEACPIQVGQVLRVVREHSNTETVVLAPWWPVPNPDKYGDKVNLFGKWNLDARPASGIREKGLAGALHDIPPRRCRRLASRHGEKGRRQTHHSTTFAQSMASTSRTTGTRSASGAPGSTTRLQRLWPRLRVSLRCKDSPPWELRLASPGGGRGDTVGERGLLLCVWHLLGDW